MSKPHLPDISAMSRQLADHNLRVARYVEALPGRVDKLVEATLARDWLEVRRLCEFLACSSDIFGCTEVAAAAHAVCQQIDKSDNETATKRSVIRLIGLCGKLPQEAASLSPSSASAPPGPKPTPAGAVRAPKSARRSRAVAAGQAG